MSREGWVPEGLKGATPVGGVQLPEFELPKIEATGPVSKLRYDSLGRMLPSSERLAFEAGITPEAAAATTDANNAIKNAKPSVTVEATAAHAGPHSARVAAQRAGREGHWLNRNYNRAADAFKGVGDGWNFERAAANATRSEIVGSVVGHTAGAVGTTARVATNVTKGAAKMAFRGGAVALGGTLALGLGANYLLNRSADSYER